MINKMTGHFEEKNENKYLVLADVDENKEVPKKCQEVWEGVKKEIQTINGGERDEYEKDLKKIRFESNDDLSMKKSIKWVSVKVLQYEKIDISEGININKTSALKECELCHYWFFKDVGFKFEEHVCNECHDLLTMVYSLKNIAILSAKGATFRSLLMGISKTEALKKLNNSVTYDRGIL